MQNTWRPRGPDAALLIILLTVAAYLPALRAGFVFDDPFLIVDNPLIKSSNGLHRFWLTTEASDYWPLTSTVWWLEWRLWGANPMGYHIVNVLFHAINAVLVWEILRRLKIPGAWVTALIFAVHPVNVASVAWVSEQKNTLSMFFYVLAILLYLRFDAEVQPTAKARTCYVLSLLTFLAALLSKAAVVMLPVVLLGCIWWRHRRVRWKDLLYNIPFFVLSLVLGLTTVWFHHRQVLGNERGGIDGFASRLVEAGWRPWFYLSKALLPIDLTVVYPKWETDTLHWVSYVPGTILVGGLIVFWWKRNTWGRPLFFGLGYFVITLFPVLGFFDQGFYRFSSVADHWQYHSIVGVVALAVAAGDGFCRRMGGKGRSWQIIISVVVLIGLAAGTWRRSCVYRNDETLWRDNVAKNPGAWLAHDNLGNALWQTGRVPEAIEHFEQALRIEPDYADTHDNLGVALWHAGKVDEAMKHWEQALRLNPNDAKAHSNLGLAFVKLGNLREAIDHWKQALQIKPDDARTHNNMASALVQNGSVEEAIEHLEQALRINPDYAEAHYNLGVALEQTGQIQESMRHYERALQIKPNYTEAWSRLTRLRTAL